MSESLQELIIIAGAGKGIGLACVNEILNVYPQYKVLALSRNTSNLEKVTDKNNQLISYQCDLSSLTSKNKTEIDVFLFDQKLKGLIFTAGILEKIEFGKITVDSFENIYKNNVWSLIDLVQTIYSHLNSSSHIVAIGSMGGHTGTLKFNEMATYSSSKAAMACLIECFAEEIKTKGSSANCLNIGAVNTEMMKTAFPTFETDISPEIMARFIINFTIFNKELFNGKVIPVSSTIP